MKCVEILNEAKNQEEILLVLQSIRVFLSIEKNQDE